MLIYSLAFVALALHSFSYIPYIKYVYDGEIKTIQLPYYTLFLNLFSAFLLSIIAATQGYYPQLGLFFIYFGSLAYLLIIKTRRGITQF